MRSLSTSIALCLALVVGCSSSGPAHFKVKGKVVDGAKPVLPDPNSSIHLTFTPQVPAGQAFSLYSAMLKSDDGTFEIHGDTLTGMPAGKYRVSLRSMSPNPSPLSQLLNRKFSEDRSPIVVDVVDDKTPLVIDIASYKGK